MARVVTLVFALTLLVGAARAANADVSGAPLPPRAHVLEDGRYASPLGFHDTVDWYRKELRRRGVNVTLVGPVRFRDVTFVRLLPSDPRTTWSAVHIILADGRTTI